MGLVEAHVDLAKAELSSIAGEIGRIAALAAIAIVVVIMAGLLAVIGTALFLGEWLLGSIGGASSMGSSRSPRSAWRPG